MSPQGKKTLKPRPPQDNQRKSRKTVRKQRNRHLLATAVLVIILLAICIFISLKVLFIVRHVEMEGSQRYNELRDELALSKFGKHYRHLDPESDEALAIRGVYPLKISEAEPKKYGGN